jgi:nitrogen fixation NifU-like protein
MTDNGANEAGGPVRVSEERIMKELRRLYSPEVIDHWRNPRNFRRLEEADGYARNKGACGDTMEMFLRVRDGRVVECAFQTDGCVTTVACGSVATELAAGKEFIEALGGVSAAEIIRALGGLPEDSVHCAQLAADTLRRALADYLACKNAPWKRAFRKTSGDGE